MAFAIGVALPLGEDAAREAHGLWIGHFGQPGGWFLFFAFLPSADEGGDRFLGDGFLALDALGRRFGGVGAIHRKGIDLLLDGYLRAFSSTEDVCLVVKDMGVETFYRKQPLRQRLLSLVGETDIPEIEYFNENLSEDEIAGLYTSCDCLVHPYRAEGFGLPIAEAMACGLPVIVTGHGAALDFCDSANAYFIPARLIPFPRAKLGDLRTLDEPFQAEPNTAALSHLLRHVRENGTEARKKGLAGRETAQRLLNWNRGVDQMEAAIEDLLSRPIRRLGRKVRKHSSTEKPRASLTMIVRNEEANIAACLESLGDLFDDKVIVDTGSNDRTREIARSFGARVFDFPWIDNFAAARNEGLRHALGDWVFWMDADDRLDDANRQNLRELLAALPNENLGYSMKCVCVADRPGGTETVVDHIRLFRRDPKVRWSYRVHEQILPAIRSTGGDVRWANVTIRHLGYVDSKLRAKKLERDLRLLQLDNAEKPDDPFILFNLGSIQVELSKPREAIPSLRRSLERSHPTDSIVRKLYALIVQCHRRLGEKALALGACQEGRKFYPNDAELLFLEGLLRREQRDFEGAERCLRRLIDEKEEDTHFASVDGGLRGYKAHHNLAVLLKELGRRDEAVNHWTCALTQQPQFLPAQIGLATTHYEQENWTALEASIEQLSSCSSGGRYEAEVWRARSKLKRGELASARFRLEQAIAEFPNSVILHTLLTHVLLRQNQDPQATEDALLAVLKLDPNHLEARNNLAALRKLAKAKESNRRNQP